MFAFFIVKSHDFSIFTRHNIRKMSLHKKITFFTFLLISILSFSQSFNSVKELANRQFPWLKNKVVVKKLKNNNNKDGFEIQTKGNKLHIAATSVSAASKGLDYYVKTYAHQSISHMGDNVQNLTSLPEIKGLIHKDSEVKYRYALNYCTINYSFSFYTWKDWEKELDWMALNGVNIMLAPVGTEQVWYNTLVKLGYTDAQAREFIPGPGFTAWWLMGNLEGWGGVMSSAQIKQQADLQKKILKRMNDLGIEPILQGFYGMVPHDLGQKLEAFKDAPIIDQGKWVFTEFTRPGILVPTTPHFKKIADVYYSEMKKLYGNDIHYFGGEPFHEGGKSKDVNIAEVGHQVQEVMQSHYPNSSWVLQGWQKNPSDELLKGLKKENVLIIELFGENTDNWNQRKGYNGTSFIWSNVSNFGEKNGLYGKLQRFIDEVFRIKASPYKGNFAGVGIIPEGIINNPVAYELMLDLAWHAEKPNLDSWLEKYSISRYGKSNPKIIEAWKEFAQTVYSNPEVYQEGPSESIFCARPSLKIKSVSSWGTRKRNYDIERFRKAVRVFASVQNEFKNSETYQNDLVDFLRQVWADKGDAAYADLVQAIESKNTTAISTSGNQFLQMVKVQDDLLSRGEFFTLNRWLGQAKDYGQNLPDKDQVMYNAKSQITYWGPDNLPKTTLRDYAHKEWNGLLGSLYYDRWKLFIHNAKNNQITPAATFYEMEVKWAKNQDQPSTKKVDEEKFLRLQETILK